MFRYPNHQIFIFMNINKTLKIRENFLIKGVYMQNFLHFSCLQSYTTCLGTNLLIAHSMFTEWSNMQII